MRTFFFAGLLAVSLLIAPVANAQVREGYPPVPGTPPQAVTPTQQSTVAIPETPVLPPGDDVAGEEEAGGPDGGVTPGGGGNGGSAPTTTTQGTTTAAADSLPFTGLEVGFVVLAGLLLIGTGVLLRRARSAS